MELSEEENKTAINMFCCMHDVRRVKFKYNLVKIMIDHHGENDFTTEDKKYLYSLRGKEALVYCFDKSVKHRSNDDWFILLDDNFCFRFDCFETIEKYSSFDDLFEV